MKIVCPNCGTAYQLSSQALGRGGRTVRCARCRSEWLAQPQEEGDHWAEVWSEPVAAPADPEPDISAVTDDGETSQSPDETVGDVEDRTIDAETALPDQAVSNIEAVARDRGRKRRIPFADKARHPPAAALAVGFGVVLLCAAVVFRTETVRLVPDLAGFYRLVGLNVNVRGLEFAGLKTAQAYRNGAPVLVVEGEIANVAGSAVTVPTIRFALQNEANREIYTWTHDVGTARLDSGQKVQFRSSIAGFPGGGDSVKMRFIDGDLRQARL